MKKILSLVLAMVMIMAMAIPAFAAIEDEVAPCAAGCVNHTPGTLLNTSVSHYSIGANNNNKNCATKTVKYYECSVCHLKFSETTTKYAYHIGGEISATCNGYNQTVQCRCTICAGSYTKTVTCPKAGHTGNCSWLVA